MNNQQSQDEQPQDGFDRVIRPPWLDMHLSKETIKHLWDITNTSNPQPIHESKNTLAGNISKSKYLHDKNDWFWKNVLKEMSEYIYLRDSWRNYFECIITKSMPLPVFSLKEIWVNYQKQNEFNPPHQHTGEFSFVVFMKIPYHWKEQHALPWVVNSNTPCASDFQFLLDEGSGLIPRGMGEHGTIEIPLSPKDEGRMLFFRARQSHQVFPFYGTEEERITISGNIVIEQDQEQELQRMEHIFEQMKQQIKTVKEQIKHEKSTKSENQKTPLSSILN